MIEFPEITIYELNIASEAFFENEQMYWDNLAYLITGKRPHRKTNDSENDFFEKAKHLTEAGLIKKG